EFQEHHAIDLVGVRRDEQWLSGGDDGSPAVAVQQLLFDASQPEVASTSVTLSAAQNIKCPAEPRVEFRLEREEFLPRETHITRIAGCGIVVECARFHRNRSRVKDKLCLGSIKR